jgi:hypothetical protein
MKTIFILSSLLFATTSFAQIPVGDFTGSVSNNGGFNDECLITQGEVRISDSGNGSYLVFWQETGMWQGPLNGFCEHDFTVSLTATATANQWTAIFNSDFDLEAGTATLANNTLLINAQYSGADERNLIDLTGKFMFSADQKSMQYSRRQQSWSGPDFFANGSLSD